MMDTYPDNAVFQMEWPENKRNEDKPKEKLTFYERVEKRIGDGFASFGRIIAGHPWKFLLVTIFINLALGVGLIRLELIIDAERVYLPQGSQARKDEERIQEIFPDTSRTNYQKLQLNQIGKWAAVLVRSKTGNLLEGNALMEISSLHDVISQIVATRDDGTDIRLTDICALVNGRCFVEGSVFWTNEFMNAVERQNVTFPWFVSSEGLSNYKTYIGGQVDRNETHLRGMEYIKIEYGFRTDIDATDDIIKWCTEFLNVLERYNGEDIETLYAHYDSLDEQLHDNVLGDLGLFAFTVAIMMAYSISATVSARLTDSVGQRVWLGAAGWLATGLSILSSIGLCAAIGIEFVSIVGVSPFLVSGIGIDDMFILLSGLSGAQTQTTVSDKLAETMRVSGVGITITTLTDLLAFGCGATSTFISVRNFCIYTGISVTFCYINNIVIFGAFIALNERRVEQNRHWFTCRTIKTKEQAKTEDHKTPYLLCCTGRPPTSRNEAESLLDKFPRWLLPKIVLVTPLKILICLIFIGYLAGAIYGCINLKQGLRFSQLPSDTSYYYAYAATEENSFPRQTPVPFIVTQHYNYSESHIQQKIENFMTKVKGEDLFEPDFEVNWLKTYVSTPYYTNASEEAFIVGLEAFLNNSLFSSFKNDVVIDASRKKITASRFYARSRDLDGSQEEGDLMLRSRDLADDFELECFAFYPSFILFEQYVLVFPQTMLTVGIALIVVLIITCFFMPHPVLILFCTIAVALIMTGVLGYMYYIDVSLSAITMVQIIMGIGFSVDFTAHICHGYMSSPGDTRNIRVKGAIDKTGSPITHGAISSLLGIAFLGAAQSYIFRTFAAVVAFVLSFGWAHALLLLPVVLSWIGPGNVKSKVSKKSSRRKQKSSKRHEDNYNTGNGYLPKQNHSNGVGYRLSNNDQNISMIDLPNGGPGISGFPTESIIPNGAPKAPIKNGMIANGGPKLSSENKDITDLRKDKGKGKHSDHIRKADVKGMKNKGKDMGKEKEKDKNLYDFDQKSSVYKIYPDIWTGDYHWETMSTKPGEWMKKMKV